MWSFLSKIQTSLDEMSGSVLWNQSLALFLISTERESTQPHCHSSLVRRAAVYLQCSRRQAYQNDNDLDHRRLEQRVGQAVKLNKQLAATFFILICVR